MATNPHFEKAAGLLIQNGPKNWDRLIYRAKILDDSALDIMFDYELDGSGDWFQIDNSAERRILTKEFRAIRDEMHAQTGDKWLKVRFIVNKDRTFNAEFEYEA